MILDFTKPSKVQPTAAHNAKFSSDSVPGTYMPNMSDADNAKWKGKIVVHGNDPRCEIRKRVGGRAHWAQLRMEVRIPLSADRQLPAVLLSANGKLDFSPSEWQELGQVVEEAALALHVAHRDGAFNKILKRRAVRKLARTR